MTFKIANHNIGTGNPVFIIAEISANHNQDFDIAVNTIHAIKKAGADAVKLQTYTPDTITINSSNKYFRIDQGTVWDGKTLYELYQEAYTPWEWQPRLKEIAEELGLVCFSSPFDLSAVDFLESIHVPAYKVASFEITDIPLIKYIASKQKPVIISTGVAEEDDIEYALKACRDAGNNQIALLKCTSSYPAPYDELNLLTIPDMIKKFGLTAGLSDHTLGLEAPVASVALGAKIIEKHFILDRKIGGPDASFSLEPSEFRDMVNAVRNTEKALGKATYRLSEKSRQNKAFSRSLFAVKDIQEGEKITESNIRSIRPGSGMHPRFYEEIIGRKKARTFIKAGTPLSFDLLT
jgi:pseudaminic acid synthase